jgi:hypothetical protein
MHLFHMTRLTSLIHSHVVYWTRFTRNTRRMLSTHSSGLLDTRSLPNHVDYELNQHPPNTTLTSYQGGRWHLKWHTTPRTVLLVKKPNDKNTEHALIELAQ